MAIDKRIPTKGSTQKRFNVDPSIAKSPAANAGVDATSITNNVEKTPVILPKNVFTINSS